MNTEVFGHQLRREVQRHTTLTVEWASVYQNAGKTV